MDVKEYVIQMGEGSQFYLKMRPGEGVSLTRFQGSDETGEPYKIELHFPGGCFELEFEYEVTVRQWPLKVGD